MSGRLGLSFFGEFDNHKLFPDLFFPVAVNAMYGYKSHHLEMGLGQTIVNWSKRNSSDPENIFFYRKTELWGFFNIGYRFQKLRGGVMVKANYSPFIYYDDDPSKRFENWFGIGVGYSFPVKKRKKPGNKD